VVVNQAPPARGIAEAALTREALDALQGFGLPVATTIIHARAAFGAALIDGRAVLELEPDGKAAGEIAALWRELETRLWL
jgi:chromosome partitioning protein